MKQGKRRFIAGAVCPKCGEMDSIVVVNKAEAEVGYRECVSCDFKEDAIFPEKKAELPTRVNQPNQKDIERSSVQVIKILPAEKK